MNHLLAKVKRKQKFFRVLAVDDNIYELPSLDDCVAYAPETLLDEEQLYKVGEFSQSGFAIDFICEEFISTSYSQISNDDVAKLSYLCSVQGDHYFFQIINSNQLIKKKWFSISELTIEENKPIVTLNKYADAIYDKASDTLYFSKLSSVNAIFKGMDQLYRQATDAETVAFLSSDFLKLKNDFSANSVKVPNRKRIALVIDALKTFNAEQKSEMFQYVQEYASVPFVDNAFEIENEEHLKQVMFGIQQRFYTTKWGNEKRLANSVISL
jgi:hypothetical protein